MVFQHGGSLGEGRVLFCPLGKGGLVVLSKQGVTSSWELLRAKFSPCMIDQLRVYIFTRSIWVVSSEPLLMKHKLCWIRAKISMPGIIGSSSNTLSVRCHHAKVKSLMEARKADELLTARCHGPWACACLLTPSHII